jgi:type VI secretion system Hcp family effector
MAIDAFLKIDGILGESLDAGHKEWIQVREVSHTIKQRISPSTIDTGGMTAAKAEHAPLRVRKWIDKASPVLAEQCSQGKLIRNVTLEFMRSAGDSRVRFIKIELEGVVISEIDMVATENPEDVPFEWVSLSYAKIKWTYTAESRNGEMSGTVPGGWDLIRNAKWG